MLQKILHTESDLGPTVARLAIGIVMFPHGAQMVLGWFGGSGFSGTMGYFTDQVGLPWIFALLVVLAEFLGSIGLILGALSRLAAGGIAIVMLGAIFTVHLSNGFFMNWYGAQQGEGFEYHILMLGLTLIVMIKGGGAVSVDGKLSV
jgi:putative oxidoreductase